MGVARWGVCPQGLKPRLIFGGFSRHGQGRALTKVTPNLLPYSANLIKHRLTNLPAPKDDWKSHYLQLDPCFRAVLRTPRRGAEHGSNYFWLAV